MYPDLAPELEEFLADQDRFKSLVGRRRPGTESDPMTVEAASPAAMGTDADPATADFTPEVVKAIGAGSRTFGPYELLGKIGEGGQGVVFKARQSNPHRIVALKLLRSGPLASTEEVRRFRGEADAAAELDHAHIVPIYQVSEHEGQWYFSMRFMEGGSLARRLPHYSTHPREAAALMVCVARAVQHAHRHGILHRDLKPSNILFDADGQPHVTDFGLAKRITPDADQTLSGVIVGTAQYMAPEQALGRTGVVTTASDVYGLGAILYTMLTGRPPFQGDSWLEILEQVKIREPELPSASNRKVGRDLETICLTCLRKDPQRRYESAEALAEDLERWLAGVPIRARRTGAWERTIKWVQRRPAIAALLGAIVLVGALGFAGVVWQLRQTQRALAAEARTNYFNRIALAAQAWADSNFGRAAELLAGCPPDQRNWEWFHLMGLRHRPPLQFKAHEGASYSVAFSRDGRLLASAGADGTVKVWDAATGRLVQLFRNGEGRPEAARCVAFSPLSARLASANYDGLVRVWDVATGHQVYEPLAGHAGRVISVAYSPDGRSLASAGRDGDVRTWDAETGRALRSFHAHDTTILDLAYSPDGRRLATASDDGVVKLWGAEDGQLIFTASERVVSVRCVAFCPGGLHLALAGGDGVVRVLDPQNDRFILTTQSGHTDTIRGVAYDPREARIASAGGDGTVKLWDLATGQEATTLRAVRNVVVRDVAFSSDPDLGRLAAAYGDGTICVWEAPRVSSRWDALRVLTGHRGPINGVAYSPEGRSVATAGGDQSIRIWDAQTGGEPRLLSGHKGQVYALAYSPDGRHLASAGADMLVRIWDPATGRLVRTPLQGHADDIWCVAYSPNGRRLASADGNGTVKLWEVTTDRRDPTRTINAADQEAWCAVFSPDSERLAIGYSGGGIEVWDAQDDRPEPRLDWKGHDGSVYGLAFSPDGRHLASAGADGHIRLWDAQTGSPGLGYSGSDRSDGVAFSPDGAYLAAAFGDGTVKVWDTGADLRDPLLVLHGHTSRILGVAFSPASRRLVSAGFDGTARVWDTTGWPQPRKSPAAATGR
jgi:WD40 repeat protein/tRNA A-37 threonylcarbamoyl transferase component Bud32